MPARTRNNKPELKTTLEVLQGEECNLLVKEIVIATQQMTTEMLKTREEIGGCESITASHVLCNRRAGSSAQSRGKRTQDARHGRLTRYLEWECSGTCSGSYRQIDVSNTEKA